jgi:methyl-accepting chemotaxis protein
MQIVPLSHDLTVISKEVSGILQSIHRQVDRVEEGIATVRDAAERLREFEETVLTRVEEPLLELATLISAVSRGVGAFLRFFRS